MFWKSMAMPGKEKGRGEKGMDTAVEDQFKTAYQELMTTAINQAKARRQVQVDYVARIAVAALVIRELNNGFGIYVANLRQRIQDGEMEFRRHGSGSIDP